ncbi:MAG: LysR family transcriptional [Geobacteraceae bacterium]|nr:MAG: LysR family transcriptional [Geobacteraceae bacterium]
MNLKQLEVFLAVAESGSFSRGAEATFITQSTVSQHISALEKEFGVKLLDRTGRGALLTSGGKVLLQHVRRIIADAREIELIMNRFKGVEDVTLSVGGSNIPGNYMIPAALPLVLERFPGLKITLLQGDSREILGRIAREEVEVGIIGSRFEDEGFTFTPLGKDEIRLIVSRQHKWRKRKSVALEELLEEEFILREPGSGTGKTVREALAKAGVSPDRLKVRAWLGSNEAVKHAVAGGLGISFLSEVSVRRELARRELAEVHVRGLRISRHFYLASRSGRELSPAAAAFAGVMREICGE